MKAKTLTISFTFQTQSPSKYITNFLFSTLTFFFFLYSQHNTFFLIYICIYITLRITVRSFSSSFFFATRHKETGPDRTNTDRPLLPDRSRRTTHVSRLPAASTQPPQPPPHGIVRPSLMARSWCNGSSTTTSRFETTVGLISSF